MLVLELFDSAVPFNLEHVEVNVLRATFSVNGKQYKVHIYTDDEMGMEDWIIEFSLKRQITITGTGDELAVFSTIQEIIYKFIARREPESFSFSSTDHEPSRVRLYTRMAKKIAAKFEYALNIENDGVDETHFNFSND